jgi:hypothetical protein
VHVRREQNTQVFPLAPLSQKILIQFRSLLKSNLLPKASLLTQRGSLAAFPFSFAGDAVFSRNAAPSASSASNSVVLNRAFLTPYSQIQTLQNWLADVLKQCPDWPVIMQYYNGKNEEQREQELRVIRERADQFVQDIVTGGNQRFCFVLLITFVAF